MKRIFFAFLTVALSFPPVSFAQTDERSTSMSSAPLAKSTFLIEEATVKEVLKSDMIMVEGNKRYRLSDILIPVDYDTLVIKHLEDILHEKKVKIYGSKTQHYVNIEGTADVDRYNIPLVNLILEGGHWVQADLVQRGMAMVYNTEGFGSDRMKMLLEMEAEARKAKAGFWSNSLYGVKTPETVKEFTNSFQVVEGRVSYITVKKNTAFVNFDRDWKTDLTLEASRSNWDNFYLDSNLSDPLNWQGRQVRVRGWVQEKNGPMIEINNKDQIELLNTEPAKTAPGKTEPSEAEPPKQ